MFSNFYSVGKCYDEFKGINGAMIRVHQEMLELVVSYDRITNEEIHLFATSPFEICYKTIDLAAYFMFRFNKGIYLDAPFNQFQVKKVFDKDLYQDGNGLPLIIYVCESTTGRLYHIRACGLGETFSYETAKSIEERYHRYPNGVPEEMFNQTVAFQYSMLNQVEIYNYKKDECLSYLVGDRTLCDFMPIR